MQFFLSLAALAGVAMAQSVRVGLPTGGQQVSRGSDFTVQVQRPNSQSGSTELGVAIAIKSCGDDGCRPAKDVLGTVLYHGEFKPVYEESSSPPYQNFTVKIPSEIGTGQAQINVAHAALIGAGPMPFLESLEQSVKIV